jgi:integral membrane protein
MLATTVGRVRAAGLIEGISFLVLVGIAMPLKYFAGMPEAVRIAGWIHGLLFMVFFVVLLVAHGEKRWPLSFTGLVFLAALVPFGPFLVDRRLKREER